jgi:uncharacterized protein with FMN-binding domain
VIPKRGAIALSLTALAIALLVSFRPPADDTLAPTSGDSAIVAAPAPQASGSTGSNGSTGSTDDSTGTTDSSGSGPAQGAAQTIDGPVVNTRFGPVQVEITVDGSQVTEVAALQLPDGDRRSAQISSRVEDTLASQALQAQSASIDGVSGATYTSEAYAESLQAALDAAGI